MQKSLSRATISILGAGLLAGCAIFFEHRDALKPVPENGWVFLWGTHAQLRNEYIWIEANGPSWGGNAQPENLVFDVYIDVPRSNATFNDKAIELRCSSKSSHMPDNVSIPLSSSVTKKVDTHSAVLEAVLKLTVDPSSLDTCVLKLANVVDNEAFHTPDLVFRKEKIAIVPMF